MIYGKCDYRMAIKVVFPLCSSFFTLLLYNLDQVETCFAKYTDYNTFSPIKVIYFSILESKADEFSFYTGKSLVPCSLMSHRYYHKRWGIKVKETLSLSPIEYNI